MDERLAAQFLIDITRSFEHYKALGEAALRQVSNDADLHRAFDTESNSIATLVKHLGGSLRSRFTEFLTTDGEKPDRDRDGEFEMPVRASRDEVMRWWNDGWTAVLATVRALQPDDLGRTVHIRNEAFLVLEALTRSATHAAYHVGQIVYLAKQFAGPKWTSLSIPRGQSREYSTGTFKQGSIPRQRS